MKKIYFKGLAYQKRYIIVKVCFDCVCLFVFKYTLLPNTSILQRRRETVCKTLELKTEETTYTEIMQRLVKRYLFKLERAIGEKETGQLNIIFLI